MLRIISNPRICPGRYLAENTLFITVSSILHVFGVARVKDAMGNEIEVSGNFWSALISEAGVSWYTRCLSNETRGILRHSSAISPQDQTPQGGSLLLLANKKEVFLDLAKVYVYLDFLATTSETDSFLPVLRIVIISCCDPEVE